MTMDDELRSLLTAVADDAPPGAAGTAELVTGRYRTRRRTRQLTGAALTVAAVSLGSLALVSHDGTDPGTTVADASDVNVLAGGPRGDLADDTSLLAQLTDLPWADATIPPGSPDAPADTREVAFAGDVGPLRTVLVTGRLDGRAVGAWFTGPSGADPAALTLDGAPGDLDTSEPIVHLSEAAAPAALVVLTVPGDVVSLADGIEVTADGQLVRDQQPVDAPDGALATSLAVDPDYGLATSVQVSRDGRSVYRAIPAEPRVPDPLPALAALPPVRAGTVPPLLIQAVEGDLLRGTGLRPGDLVTQTLWTGTIPGQNGGTVDAGVLAVTFPSGSVAVVGGWTDDASARYCTFAVNPAGTAPGDLPVAMRCDVNGEDGDPVSSVVVLGPAGATQVQLLDTDGQVTATTPLPDGVAVLAATGAERTARFTDTSGAVVATAPLSPYFPGGQFAQAQFR